MREYLWHVEVTYSGGGQYSDSPIYCVFTKDGKEILKGGNREVLMGLCDKHNDCIFAVYGNVKEENQKK